jgi:hypothetical protein
MSISVPHPAKFTDDQIDNIAGVLEEEFNGKKVKVLDPYAGTGRIFDLEIYFGHKTTAIEIEPEWANHHPAIVCADSHAWMKEAKPNQFDAVATSFVFPNRITDHHNAKDGSKRHTYKHYLGRDPSPKSSATLGWGPNWRAFHRNGFKLMRRVVKNNGLIILDSKNHFTDNGMTEHYVNEWVIRKLNNMGMPLLQARPVFAQGLRHGKNYNERSDRHLIIVMGNVK